MRTIAALFCLLLFVGSCNQLGPIGSPATASEQNSVAIKILNHCLYPDGNFYVSGGSGASISAQHALTAQHVIDCPSGVQQLIIERSDGQQLLADVDMESKGTDTARIKLSEGAFRSWITAIAPPPDVDDVVCFENTLPERSRKCGWVEKLVTDRPDADIRHSAISEPGNSGSAMYNEAGALVGIVTRLYYCPNLRNRQVCGGLASSIWKNRELLMTRD